jgi:hypothetical protein
VLVFDTYGLPDIDPDDVDDLDCRDDIEFIEDMVFCDVAL